MGDKQIRCRLAAILSANMAGYAQLIEQDADATTKAWELVQNKVIRPIVTEKMGRIIKFIGGRFLVEFSSAQDAVICALALQEKFTSTSVKFRMGISVGDITEDDGYVHGEEVNIAVLLEALAEIGGICISSYAYNQVHYKINATFQDLGDLEFKNISRPLRAFVVGAIDLAEQDFRDHATTIALDEDEILLDEDLTNSQLDEPTRNNSSILPLATNRLRGISQLTLVFNELQSQLGDKISSVELLKAAQQLIKISRGDYTDKVSREYGQVANYFARDVTTAFSKYQSQVFLFEYFNMMNCEYPEYFRDCEYPEYSRKILKEYNITFHTISGTVG